MKDESHKSITPNALFQLFQDADRLRILQIDLIKDYFKEKGINEVNAAQALMMYELGDNEVTAGDLKNRGYYRGSNVSYNLDKLVKLEYLYHRPCTHDKRAVRVGLTSKGAAIRNQLELLFSQLMTQSEDIASAAELESAIEVLRGLHHEMSKNIRYIY